MYEPNREDIEIQKEMMDEEREPFVITFFYNHKSSLYGFNARGETGFVKYGLDIVAAGVSALIINTINSLKHLTRDQVQANIHRNYSECVLPDLQFKNRSSKEAAVLLMSLELGIDSIQNTYGDKYVTIERVQEKQHSGLARFFR